MKKKILFYGNCQLGVLARYFRLNLSEQFDVQLCDDCRLEPFWAEPGLFAVWTPQNRDSQQVYKDCVHAKIQEADIFVFQEHSGRSAITELKTAYLHDSVARGLKVCIPDTRFFAHLTDLITLEPHINYIKSKEKEPKKIIKYLQESEDPTLVELLKNEYPFNKTYKLYRNENRQRAEEETKIYSNRINMCDYLENEFQNSLLCVSHNHMNENYFIELIHRLFQILEITHLQPPSGGITFPGYNSLDPRQFNFFTKIFPNLTYEKFKGKKLDVGDLSRLKK